MYNYKYPRAALTTDAIVTYQSQNEHFVLLIQRGAEPFLNKWALPGGFVNMNERLESACVRELYEETGLKVESMKQFAAYDEIERDPRHRTISIVFSTVLDSRQNVKGGDDAKTAAWFSVSDLPELAFDHKTILDDFFRSKNL